VLYYIARLKFVCSFAVALLSFKGNVHLVTNFA
jgi:hypothetical protein